MDPQGSKMKCCALSRKSTYDSDPLCPVHVEARHDPRVDPKGPRLGLVLVCFGGIYIYVLIPT